MSEKYTCPVCGYDKLDFDPNRFVCFESCPSCNFEFSVTDRDKGYTFEQWREKWIKDGLVWGNGFKGIKKEPENWNPKKQLLNIGVKV